MRLGNKTGPLVVMLHFMVASLVRCYADEAHAGDSHAVFVNGRRCMWVLAMFDLPMDTKRARREYALLSVSSVGRPLLGGGRPSGTARGVAGLRGKLLPGKVDEGIIAAWEAGRCEKGSWAVPFNASTE
jgi:hypothetical protein